MSDEKIEAKIEEINEAYNKFHKELERIKADRDKEIASIVTGIEKREMDKIREEISNEE